MKLVLLGTSGYHPSDSRHTACMMLPELGVVLDAGTAMYRVSEYLCTDTLDVFLSHAHLDHVMGLSFMFDVIAGREMRRVAVHGEPEKLKTIREHLFSPLTFPVDPPFELQPLTDRTKLSQGAVLTHFPLKHPGGSVGFRIDWQGRSMAYVTDTVAAPDADYIQHIQGVDLLVHESYFNDDMSEQAELTGHSCLSRVSELALSAKVKRLVLVHINPLLDSDAPLDLAKAQRIFPHTEIGTDRMELEF